MHDVMNLVSLARIASMFEGLSVSGMGDNHRMEAGRLRECAERQVSEDERITFFFRKRQNRPCKRCIRTSDALLRGPHVFVLFRRVA